MLQGGNAKISQGLKAGLAAGVIYGFLIGISHFSYLEVCSSTQLQYIAERIIELHSSGTAQAVFSTDLIDIPIYWGIGSLVLGVIYGVAYSLLYRRLPGPDSRSKGLSMGVIVFILGYLLGTSGFEIACSPAYFPYIALALSLPISLLFGYVLGIFYDSFGRLAEERAREIEEEKKGKKK